MTLAPVDPASVTTPILSQASAIDKATNGEPNLAQAAILAQVTVAHANDLHVQCLCWLVSFKPQSYVPVVPYGVTPSPVTTQWNFALLMADTGSLVFQSSKSR